MITLSQHNTIPREIFSVFKVLAKVHQIRESKKKKVMRSSWDLNSKTF